MHGIAIVLAVTVCVIVTAGAATIYLNHLNARGIAQAQALCAPNPVLSYQRSSPWSNVTVNCKSD